MVISTIYMFHKLKLKAKNEGAKLLTSFWYLVAMLQKCWSYLPEIHVSSITHQKYTLDEIWWRFASKLQRYSSLNCWQWRTMMDDAKDNRGCHPISSNKSLHMWKFPRTLISFIFSCRSFSVVFCAAQSIYGCFNPERKMLYQHIPDLYFSVFCFSPLGRIVNPSHTPSVFHVEHQCVI